MGVRKGGRGREAERRREMVMPYMGMGERGKGGRGREGEKRREMVMTYMGMGERGKGRMWARMGERWRSGGRKALALEQLNPTCSPYSQQGMQNTHFLLI